LFWKLSLSFVVYSSQVTTSNGGWVGFHAVPLNLFKQAFWGHPIFQHFISLSWQTSKEAKVSKTKHLEQIRHRIWHGMIP